MAIVWDASKLVIAFLIAKAFGQCPIDNIEIGPGRTFSGKVEVGGEEADPQYLLLDDHPESGITGIHFLAGCSGQEGQEGQEVVLRLKDEELSLAFVLEQHQGRLDSKILKLKPDVSYAEDLLALPRSFEITVEVK